MRILLDDNLPLELAAELNGHDVPSVRGYLAEGQFEKLKEIRA